MTTLRVNEQQLAFLSMVAARENRTVAELVVSAVAAAPAFTGSSGSRPPIPARGHVLEPGTGKAFAVPAGHVLRVEQIAGGQCVDLNVFNLHDRRERLHAGRTRGMQGPHPGLGDVLWSNAPWERPIMAIVASTTRTDTTFPFCSRLIYRAIFGVQDRTNCQEIQNEAQREYGLAPWELHESVNLFMYTADGEILRNESGPGDHIVLLALTDLLAVPNVCGDDLTACNNFGLRPVSVSVTPGSAAELSLGQEAVARAAGLGLPEPQHLPAPQPLHADPSYEPAFPYLPQLAEVLVPVRYDEARIADAALRDIVLTWAIARLGTFGG
ncbi:DUF1989 domain-containing protein [Actinoplanes couchii]|uniref:DUF1989 domain-containing protein n=1 Tax=Actinoplanes couchii TaxID=403638 RepID=A0ABQ3XSV4_9ACTN|nr:urea carboxylase-associated family protein [Actinoplanes couchii]MDR6318567.1 uncharacterized protein YcgI (DUF1989 family) [Actinoplanes couchii]GID61500.1 hypothetical protein Aco03nite_099040 [Actinoplanes couchii]